MLLCWQRLVYLYFGQFVAASPALLVQSSLRWFGHAARRPEGELIKDLLLPTPPLTWRRRAGGQLKTRPRPTWNQSPELAQDRRAWSASFRDVVNAIGDAGSTRAG